MGPEGPGWVRRENRCCRRRGGDEGGDGAVDGYGEVVEAAAAGDGAGNLVRVRWNYLEGSITQMRLVIGFSL